MSIHPFSRVAGEGARRACPGPDPGADEGRQARAKFIARGLAAREDARRTGAYYSAEESLQALDSVLAKREPDTR